ncbi:hypothetical protein N872_02080 [Neisseria meningitidis LNP27256]|nr:hypothetical protein N872_02080 [Neisseria meningitidis LNP27256]
MPSEGLSDGIKKPPLCKAVAKKPFNKNAV